MQDSVSFPVHFTEGDKMSIGFSCGVDLQYHGQFPGKTESNNPNWEEYKTTTPLGTIKIYTETEEQEISIADAIQDEKAMEILAKILQRKIAEKTILGFREKSS